VPSGYESPRVPLLKKKMCFGDSAPNNQASVRRRAAGTAPSGVGMQSRHEAPTKGGFPKDHRKTLTSSIVLTRERFLTKRQPGSGVGCTARRNGSLRQEHRAHDSPGRACRLRHRGFVCSKLIQEMSMRRRPFAVLDHARLLSADIGLISLSEAYGGSYDD
jgi:hypothetical protein